METKENRILISNRQNPLTFYLRTLLYMIMALVMRVVAFLPLGALLVFPEGSYFRWLALLCPVLLIFFILPLRFSFAQAIVQPYRERRFSFDKATSVQGYANKLGESLVHALNIIKWGIPLWLMIGACVYFYLKLDGITLMSNIEKIGSSVVAIGFSVANFFIGIFGGTQLVPNGGIMEGVYTILALLGLGVLILMWGVVRNSAFRYIWAQAKENQQSPRLQARRRLTGRRWAQLGVAFLNLILWVPACYVVFRTLRDVLSNLSTMLFNYLATQQLDLPELSSVLYPLLFAFVVCYLPLLPVRRIMTSFFATKQLRRAPETDVVADITPTDASVSDSAIPPMVDGPLFIPTPVVTPAVEDEIEEASAPDQEPTPMPVYTPVAQTWEDPVETPPVYKQEPVVEVPSVYELKPVVEAERANEPESVVEAAPAYEPEPVVEAAPVYEPEPVVEAAPVYEPEPMVEVTPANELEPVVEDAPTYEPEHEFAPEPAAKPEEATFTFEPSPAPEPEPAYETAPSFGFAVEPEQPEAPADEDDFVKPYVPSLFDAEESANPEAPTDAEDDGK